VHLHPCVSGSPITTSWGLEIQDRHAVPPWRGAPIVHHHDHIFPGEGHCVASTQVFLEFPNPSVGPRGHEIPHHVIDLELVLDGVHVVRAGLLEESLEVVCRWSRLVLATVCGSHDVPHVKAVCFLVVSSS
jgi:hypothetical protein